MKLAGTKRSEVETSHNHPLPAKGLGEASNCAEAQGAKDLPKPKKQNCQNTSVAGTALSSGQVTLQSKNLRPDAPSSRTVAEIDLFHLYNILLSSKPARAAIRQSRPHTTRNAAAINQAPILTSTDAARIFKVSTKTFLARYAPLLHPIPSINFSDRRRHQRWSRAEIERLARGQVASEFEPRAPDDELTFVSRALEKRLE